MLLFNHRFMHDEEFCYEGGEKVQMIFFIFIPVSVYISRLDDQKSSNIRMIEFFIRVLSCVAILERNH